MNYIMHISTYFKKTYIYIYIYHHQAKSDTMFHKIPVQVQLLAFYGLQQRTNPSQDTCHR